MKMCTLTTEVKFVEAMCLENRQNLSQIFRVVVGLVGFYIFSGLQAE